MDETIKFKAQLLGSLLLFTQVFYKLRTGRDFLISQPIGRESHFITSSRILTKVARDEITYLNFNMPPRYGKTEMLIHLFAWTMARWPDSNYLYVSYSHSLAKRQTQTIKQIIELPIYKKIFGVEISSSSSAKDNFETTAGGSVFAAGANGSITGRGAGIRNSMRFGGLIGIDDIIKPSEATSDTIRESTNDWYYNTLLSRRNSPNTPIINIGQRTHEDDLSSRLIIDPDYYSLILPSLDGAGNALYPEMHTREMLLKMEAENPYVFAAQYQQNPQPAGGGIFKPEWFVLLDEEPEILATFITADTAETDKDYNDATVFSFWGIYKLKQFNIELDEYGLHWIDCYESHIEPKDLHAEFIQFYASCMRHRVKPKEAAIEKKSTGVTLVSVLKDMQGLKIIDIERTRSSGSKTSRFLEMQGYIASKRISLNTHSKHTEKVINHMKKITANNSHRYDDIADTAYDAIKIALIDESILPKDTANHQNLGFAQHMSKQMNKLQNLRNDSYGRYL